MANALSFSVIQDTSHGETNLLPKQLYFQSRIDDNEMRDFYREMFFRIPSCLEQLLLVNNTFSNQLLLEDKYFFSTATVSEELFLQNK